MAGQKKSTISNVIFEAGFRCGMSEYIEYCEYMEGVMDCRYGSYRLGMGAAYDRGYGNEYQMGELR